MTARVNSMAHPVAFAALFLLIGWISGVRPLFDVHISPWSPHWGLALAYLLEFGAGALPVVVLTSLVGEVLLGHGPAQALATYAGALWLVACYTLIAGAWRRLLAPVDLVGATTATWLAIVAGLGLLAAAFGYAGIHGCAGTLPVDEILPAGTRLWIASVNGVMVVTPLLSRAVNGPAGVLLSRSQLPDLLTRLAVVL